MVWGVRTKDPESSRCDIAQNKSVNVLHYCNMKPNKTFSCNCSVLKKEGKENSISKTYSSLSFSGRYSIKKARDFWTITAAFYPLFVHFLKEAVRATYLGIPAASGIPTTPPNHNRKYLQIKMIKQFS